MQNYKKEPLQSRPLCKGSFLKICSPSLQKPDFNGRVGIDNTFTHPATSYDAQGLIPKDSPNVWYTPFYFRDVWHWRRIWAQMDVMCRAAAPLAETEQPASEPLAAPARSLNETKTGQLTLF